MKLSLIDRLRAAGVAFSLKQTGAKEFGGYTEVVYRLEKDSIRCFGCGKAPYSCSHSQWYTVWRLGVEIHNHCEGDLCPECARRRRVD